CPKILGGTGHACALHAQRGAVEDREAVIGLHDVREAIAIEIERGAPARVCGRVERADAQLPSLAPAPGHLTVDDRACPPEIDARSQARRLHAFAAHVEAL